MHALGLSLVRQKRTEEAVKSLSEAAKLAPETPRFGYVAAVALHDTGKSTEAMQVLAAALAHHPYDRQVLYALTTYELQSGQFDSALSHANLLHELEPEDQQVDRLLATSRQSMGNNVPCPARREAMPPRAILRTLCGALVASGTLAALPVLAANEKPNILFILADNTGYGDLGCLRRRRVARRADAAHRSARRRRSAPDPVSGRTGLHALPRRADDGALFHPLWPVSGPHRGLVLHPPGREVTLARCCTTPATPPRSSANGISAARPKASRNNKGFDEYYGIPPGDTWDAFLAVTQSRQTQSLDIPLDKGPYMVEAKRGEPLQQVKPYTEQVRRDVDWELVDRGVDFMRRQQAAGTPFFLYLPISRTHFPNLPSARFVDASRIGQFGDSLMEGDAVVGAMLDALTELGLEQDTIVVFASDNGPDGPGSRAFGGDMPDMGSPGPFRGALGDVSEGSLRTPAIVRWPGHIAPRSSNAMVSIMDWFATLASLGGRRRSRPTARSTASTRRRCCSAGAPRGARPPGDLRRPRAFGGRAGSSGGCTSPTWRRAAAARAAGTCWAGLGLSAAPMNGYPKVFNIESDPREEHNVAEQYDWVSGPLLQVVADYKKSLEQYPNPPAPNITRF